MKSLKIAAVATALVISTSANAALLGRLAATEGGTDYQAYYDTEADLTWLADANPTLGSVYDYRGNGIVSWRDATKWVADLSVGGVDGWRLPDPDNSCQGYNCTNSEMGSLFYNVLGNTAKTRIVNTGPFNNVQDFNYWLSAEYYAVNGFAYTFDMGYGSTGSSKGSSYVWAVQSGDVSAVPVPAAVWLFGTGLIGLAGVARRKKA